MIYAQSFSDIFTNAKVYSYLYWAGATSWENSLAKDFRLDMERWAKKQQGIDTIAAMSEAENASINESDDLLLSSLGRLNLDGYSHPGCFIMTAGQITNAKHFVAIGFDEDYNFRGTTINARRIFGVLNSIELRNSGTDYLREVCIRCQKLVGRKGALDTLESLGLGADDIVKSAASAYRYFRNHRDCLRARLPGFVED